MTQPRVRSSGGEAGWLYEQVGVRAGAGDVSDAEAVGGTSPASSAAAVAVAAKRSWAIRTRVPESATIQAISGPTRWWLTGTR